MKKYVYCAIMALFAISCSQKEDILEEIVPDKPSDALVSFYAEIPRVESRAVWNTEFEYWDGLEPVNSRTYAVIDTENSSEYYQYWHEGDAISLFSTTQNLQYVLESGQDTDLGKFELSTNNNPTAGEDLSTGYYYSVYPYKEDTQITSDGQVTFTFPEMQEYNVDSYAKGANGMIAKNESNATDNVYEFKNFCSYLQLRLTYHEDKEIDRIILKANNENDLMSGVGTITYNTDAPVVSMIHELSSNELALECRNHHVKLNPTTPTNFWFVLPGGFTFSDGFNITVVFKDGSFYKKKTGKTISIQRNHITPMAPFTIDNVLTSVIRYKYENPDANANNPFPFASNAFTNEAEEPLVFHQHYDPDTKEWIITFDGILNNIGSNIFDKSSAPNLDYIIIENSETIDFKSHAFWRCTADSITINNDISTIAKEAFGFSNIKNITVNGDIHNILEQSFVATMNLNNIEINGHVHSIEEFAFLSSGVDNITISERVTEIADCAFMNCTSLQKVTMPGVEHIGENAFSYCYYLSEIDLNHVHKIGYSAFKGCISLQTITIGEDCISIDEGAFAECSSLTTVYINATTPPTISHDGSYMENPYIFPDCATIYVPNKDVYNQEQSWWWYSNNNPETNRATLSAQ